MHFRGAGVRLEFKIQFYLWNPESDIIISLIKP
jgi:hypothetical protein